MFTDFFKIIFYKKQVFEKKNKFIVSGLGFYIRIKTHVNGITYSKTCHHFF